MNYKNLVLRENQKLYENISKDLYENLITFKMIYKKTVVLKGTKPVILL